MPISLEPGVGIQLTFPPFPSLAGCVCCLTLRPDSGLLHFLSSWAQWTPVVTVIEGSQIFCDHSATSSCSYWSSYREKMHVLVYILHKCTVNLRPASLGSRLEGYLLKSFSCCAFCHSANVAVGLFYSGKDGWQQGRISAEVLCATWQTFQQNQVSSTSLKQAHTLELVQRPFLCCSLAL